MKDYLEAFVYFSVFLFFLLGPTVFGHVHLTHRPYDNHVEQSPSDTVPANCKMREELGMPNACHRKEWV